MLDILLNALTVFAWVIFIIFLGFITLRAFQKGGAREVLYALTRGRVLAGLFLTLSLTLVSASLVFIEPQEVGVVISVPSRDGYREQPLRSGLHWIVPLAERVVLYPIYWQTYTMSTEPFEGTRVGKDAIAARSSDGQAVYLDSSIIFRVDPNEVIRVHIDFQDRYINDFIRPVMRGMIRSEVSQFTADEINSSRRKNLEANLEELLREEFSAKGFVLDQFLLRNISFSEQYAAAVEAKQVAEQARTQREYEAEQIRKLAEGQRDKLQIEAAGQAEAIRQKGQADADVVRLKAQAEAEALRLIAEALKDDANLLLYRYIDKLGPGVRVMLVPNDNPYLLSLPSLDEIQGTPVGTLELPSAGTSTQFPDQTAVPTVTTTPTPTPTPAP